MRQLIDLPAVAILVPRLHAGRGMTNHSLTAVAIAAALSLASVTTASAGVLTTPVPEPGTLALLGTGVAAIAAGAWWRNRK